MLDINDLVVLLVRYQRTTIKREAKGMDQERSKTVLVVEDEALLRDLLVQHLELNFSVITAGTGQAAIQVIESNRKFDLLLTDFDLHTDLDGLDVARAAKTRYSHIPILLVTGSSPDISRVQEILSYPNSALLNKPFHLDALDRMIRRFLT